MLQNQEYRDLLDEKNIIEMDRNEIQVENIVLKEQIEKLKDKIRTLKVYLFFFLFIG